MSTMQPGGQRPPSRASHASRTSEVSRGAQSLYSVGSVHSVRSTVRSTVPLAAQAETWKPPVLKKAFFTSIPKASNITAIYSIVSRAVAGSGFVGEGSGGGVAIEVRWRWAPGYSGEL